MSQTPVKTELSVAESKESLHQSNAELEVEDPDEETAKRAIAEHTYDSNRTSSHPILPTGEEE